MDRRTAALLISGTVGLIGLGLVARGIVLYAFPPPSAPRSLALVVVFGGICGVLGGVFMAVMALTNRFWRQ